MSKHLLFYDNPVPVNLETHKDARVRTDIGLGFAREVNSVPLVGAEFARAALEFPIVFAGGAGDVMPSAVVGMGDSGNAFVGADGNWQGSYLPGFIRRYPFIFGTQDGSDQAVLMIDEKFEGLGAEGERLFDDKGARSDYLNGILQFGEAYLQQFRLTAGFCLRLKELDLLQPMQADYKVDGAQEMSLTGFQTINREKFKELPAEAVAEFFANDALECVYLHFASLENFPKIAQRAAAMGA